MEHRKFLQRLDELVAKLTHAQAQKVIAALQQRGDGDEVQRILEQHLEDDPNVHTAARGAVRAGAGEERPAAQPLPRLPTHLQSADRHSAGPAAQKGALARLCRCAQSIAAGAQGRQGCKVNKNTAFKWRHRFLKAQNQSKDQSLAGIAEVDEIFLLESSKASASCRARRANAAALPKSQGYRLSNPGADRP